MSQESAASLNAPSGHVMTDLLPKLLIFYALCIFAAHTIPSSPVPLEGREVKVGIAFFRVTHLLHFGMFLPWGFLTAHYVYKRSQGCFRRAFGWTVLGVVLAIAAEGIQYWLPARSFRIPDMLLNISGVLAGTLLAFAVRGGRFGVDTDRR